MNRISINVIKLLDDYDVKPELNLVRIKSMKNQNRNIAIIGASGAIGRALVEQLTSDNSAERIHAFSRSGADFQSNKVISGIIDFEDESSIQDAAKSANKDGPLDLLIIATGFLHDEGTSPEKSIRDISHENFIKNFTINTIGPALIAKHFLPIMSRETPSVFSCISARVGSISDNRLGGWYAYRASKAALNMTLKNLSIEASRRFKQTVVVGLHPGTVDSSLSKPFQASVSGGKLFTPKYSAQSLIDVIDNLKYEDNGKIFAWDGSVIEY